MRVADSPVAGAQGLCRRDPRYPALLRTIPDPPKRLYLRGDADLLQRPMLAIVGARRATAAGLQAAAELAAAAVDAGLAVCSGLALGIDGAAHAAALRAGGATVAVMGTGIDEIYPESHHSLAEDIARSGCLLTEYPPDTPPRPGNFPRRNRIISGLSLGVVVVEAALRSGSLITARTALEQGREVFALPWSVAHSGGAGCLRLLREGAKMVLAIDDILEELGALYRAQQALSPAAGTPGDEDPESVVLALIGYEEVAIEQLVRASGLAVGEVMTELSDLELRGYICRGPGGYVRVARDAGRLAN